MFLRFSELSIHFTINAINVIINDKISDLYGTFDRQNSIEPIKYTCTECEDHYYTDNNQCKQCNESCLTCTGPSETECTSYNNSFYVDSTTKTDIYSRTYYFTKTDKFSQSSYFSFSEYFSETFKFSRTNFFSKSNEFSNSNYISQKANAIDTESDEPDKSITDAESEEIDKSIFHTKSD